MTSIFWLLLDIVRAAKLLLGKLSAFTNIKLTVQPLGSARGNLTRNYNLTEIKHFFLNRS